MIRKKRAQENTILDIAGALKLSAATVSRALNGQVHVKEKTRNDVLKMAEKLGYRRNQMASGLRSNKTYTVGLIVPRISMFFHAEVITTIQNNLHKHGYNLMICQSNDDISMEKELTEILFSSRVDALIVACTLFTTDFSHFLKFMESGVPVFFYDRVPPHLPGAMVIRGDDIRGGYLAASHLIETGCRHIAHISGPLSCNLYRDRSAGFYSAMEQHHIAVNEDWIFHQELTTVNAREAMRKLFEGKKVPDGLCTDNDSSAIAALEYARETGINVPKDLKIIGYSNDPRTAIISPAITTIEQFPNQVGKKIVDVLVDLLKNEKNIDELSNAPIIIPTELIRRMST
ncbi:MAG TPA: LacI family DNA-binding transcriptional regulator [Pedobacter sp.]|uniref:LacI family DNA-binding transcriptional regulator n=1 Tax=Pedobacter sp. TaxID=1411316 RepID=UPI002C5EF7B9|nr:LacI family DNA-binding transcriptional regulator [Pedobacter sp.]HMI03755.1 LacI family DNA-binding transcriptional regulator [Pedobacter sp.]